VNSACASHSGLNYKKRSFSY